VIFGAGVLRTRSGGGVLSRRRVVRRHSVHTIAGRHGAVAASCVAPRSSHRRERTIDGGLGSVVLEACATEGVWPARMLRFALKANSRLSSDRRVPHERWAVVGRARAGDPRSHRVAGGRRPPRRI
jgi:hypothetical protein